MSTKLSMLRDINGFCTFGLTPADDKQNAILAATTAQTFTVPATITNAAAIFYFAPGSSVWVAHNDTATLPSSSVSTANSEGNPTVWKVKGGDTISMVTNDTTAEVGVKYYEF